jgi:hypothetical protein
VIVFQNIYLRVVVIVFQSIFYLKIHQNNIYIYIYIYIYILKNYFYISISK